MELKSKSSSNSKQQSKADDKNNSPDLNLQSVSNIPVIDNSQSLDDNSSMQNINNDNVNSLPSTTQPISDSLQPSPIPIYFQTMVLEMMRVKNEAVQKLA